MSFRSSGHCTTPGSAGLAMTVGTLPTSPSNIVDEPSSLGASEAARVRRVVDDNYGILWRTLRRLGVAEADADDGVQHVFGVFVRRLPVIAVGAERSFLFQTAVRVAAGMRRAVKRSRLQFDGSPEELADDRAGPDIELERAEARALLTEALGTLDLDVCTVFVLFELEDMTTSEISDILGIPPGTVSSRLKRARKEFKDVVARLERRPLRSERRR